MEARSRETADGALDEDYSDEAATFGDRLVRAREAQGMGQAQLAQRLGIKLATLRNWEEDRSEPRANKLQMVAGMLNVSMVWLMSGQGETPAFGDGVAEEAAHGASDGLLTEIRAIRAEQVRLVERLARMEKRLRAALA